MRVETSTAAMVPPAKDCRMGQMRGPPVTSDEREKAVTPRNTSMGAARHAARPGFEALYTNCKRGRRPSIEGACCYHCGNVAQ